MAEKKINCGKIKVVMIMDIGRRKIVRYPCTVLGSYEDGHNKPLGVKCFDINSAGAGLASFDCLPIGARLRINLCTKTEKPLLVEGVVRWCTKIPNEWRAGVEFTERITSALTMAM